MKRRVLIIDDEPSYGTLIAEAAEDVGFESMTVTTAMAALDAIETFRPDLAFVDLRLPDMDGVELLRRLRGRPALPRVVLMSGVDDRVINMAAEVAEGCGARVTDRLSKPFEIDDLIDLLERERAAMAHFHINEVALIEDIQRGDFDVLFQPVTDLADSRTCAIEAALRWRTADGRHALPEQFLPLVASTEAESRLLLAAFERTASALSSWNSGDVRANAVLAMPMSFLCNQANVDALLGIHRASGLGPSMVVAISERDLETSGQEGGETVLRLRLSDLGVALDGFGAGAMSLHSLLGPPFTEVHIAAEFLEAACRRADGDRVLTTLAAMANAMGLTLCARGVDSGDMLSLVAQCGFHRAQGAAVGKAMSLDALSRTSGNASSGPTSGK